VPAFISVRSEELGLEVQRRKICEAARRELVNLPLGYRQLWRVLGAEASGPTHSGGGLPVMGKVLPNAFHYVEIK
jgi:hypothetical protein